MGTPKRTQPPTSNPRKQADDRRPIQLPPLSSPKDGPPRERVGRKAAKPRCLHPSRGGDQQFVIPCYGQLRTAAYPQESGRTVAKPAIHRPQRLPATVRQRDFGSPAQAEEKPANELIRIGFRPPQRGLGSDMPLMAC